MIAQMSETLFSPMVLLWIAASVLAAVLLIGAASKRRANLTESLRDYVDRQQQKRHPSESDAADQTDSDK